VKVAVIFHRFGPYHFARLEATARRCETIGIEVAAETPEYAWSPVQSVGNYSRLTLFPNGEREPAKRVSRRMEDALRTSHLDAVAIPGWSGKAAIAALRWCAESRTPAILMSESAALDQPRMRWREWIKQRIVSLYSSALVGGQRHIDYLVQLGMPRDRIFTGYDVVDNGYFAQRAKEVRNQKEELRSRYGLPENYFLASARFIEKKNLLGLVRAYAEYRQRSEVGRQQSAVSGRNAPWDLVLLGEGPLQETLNTQLSALNLHAHVHLPGFKQYDELPVYYALAKAFVHASTTEQWGLVVNEAIASGLPVIVSERCGCVPELVGNNGFTFDPVNEDELASRLFKMASLSEEDRKRLEGASRGIAANFGPERFGEGLEKAARLALSQPRKISRLGQITAKFVAAVP
jgi:glycosyltransferase involved in cell wall biosynthesis